MTDDEAGSLAGLPAADAEMGGARGSGRRRSGCLTRRAFVAGVASAGLAWRCAPPRPRIDADVIVLGGGIAGLFAVHLLRGMGRRTLLLEASGRLGGRIRTLRSGLPEGLRAEAGAEQVAREHVAVRALLRELAIPCEPYRDWQIPAALTIEGQVLSSVDASALPASVSERLNEFERAVAPPYLPLHYARSAEPPAPADPRTGLEWLRESGLTELGERFVRAFSFTAVQRMGAYDLHRTLLHEMQRTGVEVVQGGTERIVEALAARHSDLVRRGCAVTSVEADASSVVVQDSTGRTYRGRAAIACLPLGPARALLRTSRSFAGIAREIEGLEGVQEIKLHWSIRRAELRAGGPRPLQYSDRMPHAIWTLPSEAGGRVVRTTVAMGEDVERVRSSAARGDASLRALLDPEGTELKSDARVLHHDFGRDAHIGAAFTVERPGTTGPRGTVGDGRLVLAGSDVSAKSGWMEGALGSAREALERVARDVLPG